MFQLSLRARQRLAVLAALVVVASVAALKTAPPSRADTTLNFYGHGWGHGRGMGQYGALGYAINSGWSTAQILGHYYGGTSAGSVDPASQMSVRMTAVDAQPTIVYQEKGQLYTSADDPSGTRSAHTALKIERVSDGVFRVSDGGSCNGPWTPRPNLLQTSTVITYPGTRSDDVTTNIELCEPNGRRWVYGELNAIDWGGKQWTTNTLQLDQYVKGVVPREMPASWADLGSGKGMEALKTQTIAARSYGFSENRFAFAKTCDNTACQVYGGRAYQGSTSTSMTNLEDNRSNTAVSQTAGQVRMLNGAVARTEFSSSTGGYTAGGTFPAVPDDGDAVAQNPNHNWSATLAASTIEAKYGKGTLQSATVTARNGLGADGGRVTNLHLVFSGGVVDTSGASFAGNFGLKSDWWTIGSVGTAFSGWEPLGGNLASAPVATSWGTGRLDVFAEGADRSVVHTWYGGSWGNFESLGGVTDSPPAAASMAAGRLDIFHRGTDGQLWHKWFSGAWSAWEPLGGGMASGPSVSANPRGPTRLDVFARGSAGDLMHKWWAGSWSGWESLGGSFVGEPAAVLWPNGRIDVFARASDNSLRHIWFGGAWSGWENIGGVITSPPTAAAWDNGRLDVFARGNDGSVAHISWGGAWSVWESLGGSAVGAPGVASWAPGRLDLFHRGQNNMLYHSWSSR